MAFFTSLRWLFRSSIYARTSSQASKHFSTRYLSLGYLANVSVVKRAFSLFLIQLPCSCIEYYTVFNAKICSHCYNLRNYLLNFFVYRFILGTQENDFCKLKLLYHPKARFLQIGFPHVPVIMWIYRL
jgi:hypothetical protein